MGDRYPVHGDALSEAVITVYDKDTLNASEIYAADVGGAPLAGGQISADSNGKVLFFVDSATYPIVSLFDIKGEKTGYADAWVYDVWNYFNLVTLVNLTIPSAVSPYTLADMRTRLATFYSLDETDSQIKKVLNECIQTGYEKVISMVNMHSKQRELTENSVANQKEYSVNHLGIPTYVGYKTKRLIYLPYEVFREKYNNFGTGWDDAGEDPVNYSLVGYDGEKKTLVIAPAPKVTGEPIYVLCFQNPGILSLDTDYPLVPQDWTWLVLERAKVERIRFERDDETYRTQAQEFVAYVKVMVKRLYPAAPEPEAGFVVAPERVAYNAWRNKRI